MRKTFRKFTMLQKRHNRMFSGDFLKNKFFCFIKGMWVSMSTICRLRQEIRWIKIKKSWKFIPISFSKGQYTFAIILTLKKIYFYVIRLSNLTLVTFKQYSKYVKRNRQNICNPIIQHLLLLLLDIGYLNWLFFAEFQKMKKWSEL